MGRDYYWISEADSADQAEFWLAESRRILEEDDRPELALGAAWVLNDPGPQELWCQPRNARLFAGLDRWQRLGLIHVPDAEIESSRRAERFESLCRDECLSIASSLTKVAPDNPEYGRTLAWLQFRPLLYGIELQPRSDEWLETLDECAAHDPDNALYNYLAAVQLWNQSADYRYAGGGASITVTDPDRFEQGWRRFAAAQAKPHLLAGPSATPHVVEFLDRARIPALARVQIAERNTQGDYDFHLRVSLLRWLNAFSEVPESRSRMSAIDAPATELFRLVDQLETQGEPLEVDRGMSLLSIRRSAWWARHETLVRSPNRFTAEEGLAIRNAFRAALFEWEEKNGVGHQFWKGFHAGHHTVQALSVVLWSLETVFLLSVAIFVSGRVLSYLTRRPSLESPGNAGAELWRDVFLWSLALAITFLIRGAWPAETFGKEFPARILRELLLVVPPLLLAGIVIYLLRRGGVSAADLFAVGASALTAVTLVAAPGLLFDRFAQCRWNATSLAALSLIAAGVVCYSGQRTLRFWLNEQVPAAVRCYLTAACIGVVVWQIVAVPIVSDLLKTYLLDRTINQYGTWPTGRLRLPLYLRDHPGRLAWACWLARGGISLTLVCGMILTSLDSGLLSWSAGRRHAKQRFSISWRELTSHLCCRISRLSMRIATLALVAYLVLAPLLVDRAEQNYRSRLAYLKDLSLVQEQYNAIVLAVHADESLMAQFREKAAEIEDQEIRLHAPRQE